MIWYALSALACLLFFAGCIGLGYFGFVLAERARAAHWRGMRRIRRSNR